MNNKRPTKSVKVESSDVLFIGVSVFFLSWLLPFLLGKYAIVNFPYIPEKDILRQIVSIDFLNKQSFNKNSNIQSQIKFNKPSKKNKNRNAKVEEQPSLLSCPAVSPLLKGLNYQINNHNQINDDWSTEFPTNFAHLHNIISGGFWEPLDCEAQYAVTVIIGQRDRTAQLHQLLLHLHPFLKRQQLRYRIVVVEQSNKEQYNRGKLFNIGYREAVRAWPAAPESHCIVVHDVDLLPLNDHNIYACTRQPRHMSVAVDKFRFQLPYQQLCGGAVAIQARQFEAMNGFSNRFAGWGGEDDDFCQRIYNLGLELDRFDPITSTYTMLVHKPATASPHRYIRLAENVASSDDGLSSLRYTNQTTLLPLYTLIKATW